MSEDRRKAYYRMRKEEEKEMIPSGVEWLKLRECRELVKKSIYDSGDGILVLSGGWESGLYNPSFSRLLGLTPEEPIRRLEELQQFFDHEEYERCLKSFRNDKWCEETVRIMQNVEEPLQARISIKSFTNGKEGEEFIIVTLSRIDEANSSNWLRYAPSTHDPLTGLPNRLMLLEYIEQALQRAIRQKQIGALFFIDLDNFKEINDTMGHAAGDKVLIECARRIRSIVRKSDIFGRLGGDEFLLITEGIKGPDSLMNIAQKIIQTLNKPLLINGYEYRIGASVGIATFPQDSRDSSELLQCADLAMYRAKKSGKNRYQFYSKRLDEEVQRHATIQKALRYALDHDGFYLVFQPQIDLHSERLVGLEVLIRIDEKIAGPLLPAEFIPIAEENELILHLGRWVFRTCCQQIHQWSRHFSLEGLRISINLSQRQLNDPGWVRFVDEYLRRYRINPSIIEFEITETAFVASKEIGYDTIRSLQRLGCKIAIDDFGTGYSSLSTLKELTIDKLKIDQSFIEDIVQNSIDRTIVKASIAMAQAMGLSTIAEGVETIDQKKMIKMLGCSQMQGYLVSEPKKADEIMNCLQKYSLPLTHR